MRGAAGPGRCICFFFVCSAFDLTPAADVTPRLELLLAQDVLKTPGGPWESVKAVQPFVGLKCDDTFASCGDALVCLDGVCSTCVTNKDCADKFACVANPVPGGAMACMPRDLLLQWNKFDVVCTVFIVLTAALSAAAGLGGGGVYVPLTILLIGLKTSEAVPLSQTMVLAGSIVNVALLINDRHPNHPERPKIAYDVVMMLNPGLAAGVIMGVMAHLVSPAWLTLSCLFVTLVVAFQKSFSRGSKLFAAETIEMEQSKSQGGDGGSGAAPASAPVMSVKALKQAEEGIAPAFMFESVKVVKAGAMIFLCWFAFLMINMMHPERCSQGHWLQLFATLTVAAVFTVIASRASHLHNDDLSLTGSAGYKFGALAVLAGFLGGFLGIGGGLVMGPVLLEMGLIPEVSQATTAMFVLLSSSLGTMQFILLGKEMPYYVMWYAFWVTVSTVAGQMLSDYIVKVYKRVSFIVFAVSGVVAMSAVMMVWVGSQDVMENWATGRNLGIDTGALCNPH